MRWIMRILMNWATLMIVAGIFAPQITIDGAGAALLAALILSLVNAIVKPILVFFTLPITIVTLGLFLLVINAITLMITASFIDGFTIASFWTAFWAGIIVSILNTLIQKLIIDRMKKR
jgi:putative membrane protein